mmetsp:Transcript_102167/g.274356  ORF Transcript_102167/g.274356 Transcript_102167/m.274356 type:complete len:244 (-) Transcript_102167:118-849(-)
MVHGDAAAAWSRVEMQQPIGVKLLSPMTPIPAPHVQIPPPTGNRAILAIEAVGLYSQHVPRRHHAKVGPRCLDLRGVAWTQLSVLPIDWQLLPTATGDRLLWWLHNSAATQNREAGLKKIVELKYQRFGKFALAIIPHVRLQLAVELHAPSLRVQFQLQHKGLGCVRQLPRLRNWRILLRPPTAPQAMVHSDDARAWSRVEVQHAERVGLLVPLPTVPAPHVQVPTPTCNRAILAVEALGFDA